MKRRAPGMFPCAAAVALALCAAPTAAQDAPPATTFAQIDPAALTGPDYYSAKRFPALGHSAFHPDGGLPAPVRAVLMVDAHEDELRHVRYRVRYHLVPGAGPDDAPVAEVEVLRLNMGQAFRDDLIAQDPNLPVAPPGDFGSGPHVAYRFRMGPIQGMEAAIETVQRREVSDAQAQAARCLDMPCLELAPGPGPGGEWQSIPAALPELPFATTAMGNPASAAVLAFLLDGLGEDARMPLPRGDSPRMEFVISHNTYGQDDSTVGLGRNAVVLDDRIGTLWVRWRVVGEATADASLLPVQRSTP